VIAQPSTEDYISTFYPRWSGEAKRAPAAAIAKHIDIFELDGGMAMSETDSGTQWDLLFG
jgi:alpha,alpha-trehalase